MPAQSAAVRRAPPFTTRRPMASSKVTVITTATKPNVCTAEEDPRSMAASHEGTIDAFIVSSVLIVRKEMFGGKTFNTAKPTHKIAQTPRIHCGGRRRRPGFWCDEGPRGPGHAARASTM